MFCPRCGSANTETIKFCRQCGLALQEVSTYVATGGTQSLTAPTPPLPSEAAALLSGTFTPHQKMILAILACLLLPPVAAVIGDKLGLSDAAVPFFAMLIPLGITVSVMYFRNQAKRLAYAQQQALLQQQVMSVSPARPNPMISAAPPPALPAYASPVAEVGNLPKATPTNPFDQVPRHSVTEEETRRFQQQ